MEKIETFEEAKLALKDKEIITSNGKDIFYYSNDLVTHKFNGNIYRLSLDDFSLLYKETTFYYPELPQEVVDESKDEEYYGRIQKAN